MSEAVDDARAKREVSVRKAAVLVCGPPVSALGGGPAHIRNLLASPLADRFRLVHFETGSRGPESPASDEGALARLWRMPVSAVGLMIRIAKVRPAVVHINSAVDHRAFWRDLLYLLVCKLCGRPVVLQLHGGSIPLARFCRSRFMRYAAKTVFSLPESLVLLAQAEKRDFARLGGRLHISVILNGIDVGAYGGRTRIHSGQIRNLVYVGRLLREKGLFEVIEAVGVLVRFGPFQSLKFRIAGSGPARKEVGELIEKLGLGQHVQLVGPVFGKDKIEFLRAADVFVFPTYHQEGLPYAILESLAAGTPVIASPVAGVPDVIIDGAHGALIQPREPEAIVRAIVRLSASEESLRKMSCRCVEWAEHRLDLARLAKDFGELYERLGSSRRLAP